MNQHNHCLIIDPGEAIPVLNFIKKNKCILSGILITHQHWDHCAGIKEILEKYPVPVFYPHMNMTNIEVKILADQWLIKKVRLLGHTQDHVGYYHQVYQAFFTGDTLFTGGCGRIFEGTAIQLYQSLQKICTYPDQTWIYCGHEYTAKNLQFASYIEPDNQLLKIRLAQTAKRLKQNLPTVPATLLEEKQTNPFLRCHLPTVINFVQKQLKSLDMLTPEMVFTYLREFKNHF